MITLNQTLSDITLAPEPPLARPEKPERSLEPATKPSALRRRIDTYLADLFKMDTVVGKYPMRDET